MDLAQRVDYTILRPDCTKKDIKQLCEEALSYGFAAVCVPPFYVKDASGMLEKSEIKVATVVGFPMGYAAIASKIEEIKRAFDEGAEEIDAVINICAVKNGNWNYARNEAESLATACHMRGKTLKLIIETGLLTETELRKICEICTQANVDFVKTSTGYNGPGATVEAVKYLRKNLPKSIRIEASDNIQERALAEQLVQAGADRLGTTTGPLLVQG